MKGDYAKIHLRRILFNNNVIDKVNLRPVNPDKPLTLENLIDAKAASAVNTKFKYKPSLFTKFNA